MKQVEKEQSLKTAKILPTEESFTTSPFTSPYLVKTKAANKRRAAAEIRGKQAQKLKQKSKELRELNDNDKMQSRMTRGRKFERKARGRARASSVDLGFNLALNFLDDPTNSTNFLDDSINSMKQQFGDKTPDTITRATAEGCQGCVSEQVHECEDDMDIKQQQGDLCGGGQDDDGSIQPPQARSYAMVLASGLQGGGKDGKTSHRNSNPASSPFLRLENPTGSNACFANSVMQLLQKSGLAAQLIEDPQKPLCSALSKLYKQKEEGQAKNIRTLVARISGKKHFEEVRGRGTQEDASSYLESLEQIIASELASTGHRGELSYNRSFKNQPGGRCPRCNTTPRPRVEPFLQLAVPVPASGLNHSLGSILAKFFAPNIESENIKCSECCIHDRTRQTCTCSKVPSEDKMSLARSPTTLFIQLLRYSMGSKVMTPVALADEVYVNGTKYTIHGAIVHQGATVNIGHYVTFLNHSGSWFLHDDDKPAQKVMLKDIDHRQTYVLMLKKCEADGQIAVTPATKRRAMPPTQLESADCQLCINSKQHHCQICKKPVCNFHSEPFDDTELHRVHPQCQAEASTASSSHDESESQGCKTPASKRLKHVETSQNDQDIDLRIALLKELKSKRSESENEELLSLLTVKANELKEKGKSKSDEEKKKMKGLTDQISRLRKGKEHYDAEQARDRSRKNKERGNRTPEKLSLDRDEAKKRMAKERGNRTPEKLSLDRDEDKKRKTKERQQRTLMKNFREETKFGPHFVCIACHRKLFKTSVQIVDEKMEKGLLSKKQQFLPAERVQTQINGSHEYICKTCIGYLKRNKMPKMGVANNLSLNPIPKDQELTIMEGLTIAKLIIFQMIRLTPKSRWRRLQDRLISVPVMEEDVINTISQLPRTPQEAGLVAVTFKRKLEYKTSHIKETLINPHKIYKVLSELVNNGNPYYREFQEYQAFKERCIQEDEDGVRLVFPKEEEVEDILNLSDLSIEDDVPPGLIDLSIEDDNHQGEFDEEEYRAKDPVKKFQLEGHNRSSCLNNKFPEEVFEDDTVMDSIKIAPGENKIPINLLAHHDWDIQAFPYMHNYDGSNGLHQKRDVKLSLQEYCQQRILNHDPRFRENHMYLYACVGAIEKNQIQRNINLSYSRGKVQEGAGSAVTMKLDDPYVCLEDIKNTPRYWKKEKYVMNAKLENLGAFNVFFTLSCADGRWPEVVGGILAEKGYEIEVRTELCGDGYEVNQVFVRSTHGDMVPLDEFLEKESPESRHELLRGSVLQATRYFNERVRKFISKMVMDKRSTLSVKYYTYKVEFQQVF